MKIYFSRIISLLLSRFFDWLYTSLAWAYDAVANLVSLGRWRNWVLAILPYTTPTPTLEVGFGPGHLLAASSQRDSPIYGIDLSRQMCRLARNRLQKAGQIRRIARADFSKAPFADESFSRIVATFPAPALLSPQAAKEFQRLLKPGGILVVLLSVQMNGVTLPERGIRWLLQGLGPDQNEAQATETLFRVYQEQGLNPTWRWIRCGQDDLLVLFFQKPGFIIKGF